MFNFHDIWPDQGALVETRDVLSVYCIDNGHNNQCRPEASMEEYEIREGIINSVSVNLSKGEG